MKLNIITLLLVGLIIGVIADRQSYADRTQDDDVNDDELDEVFQYQPRFGGKNSVLLRKQKLVEDEAAADTNDEEDDAESTDDKLSDKNKENLIGFVPVKGQNGDTYLIPQSAIETIQKEYEAAGNQDGAILVPEGVVEVVGQGISDSAGKDGEAANVVIPKDALAGVDGDSVLALVRDGNYLGQNILVLKNIQSDHSELLGRRATYDGKKYSTKRRNSNKSGGYRRNFNVKRYSGSKHNSGRYQYYNDDDDKYIRKGSKKNRNGSQYRRYNPNRRYIQPINLRRYYEYLI